MMPTRFCYLPTLNVRITRAELVLLRAVCERHYDSTVRSLSIAGPGAVLNAAHNMFEADDRLKKGSTAIEVEFSFYQLDLLAKGLEGAQTPEERGLYLQTRKMMSILGGEADSVNRLSRAHKDDPQWWKGMMNP